MEIRSYQPLEQDTVYDIAARLYNEDTPLGMADLLSLNPNIILEDAHSYGPVQYTYGLKRKRPVISVAIVDTDPSFYIRVGQSHYDLAIQLYGHTDGLAKILGNLPSLDAELVPGTQIQYPFERTQNSLFFLRNLVATWIPGTGNNYRLLEDATYRLLEDGTIRLLE